MRSVLIAGGGIIGLAAAWRLAQAGCSVTICEQTRAGQEATRAAAGMLAPGGEFEARSRETDWAIASRGAYSGFVRELEKVSDERIDYQECGALELACSEAELAALDEKAARQSELGIVNKLVTSQQAAAFWPYLDSGRLQGARFYPNDAHVDPRQLTRALLAACQKAGVALVENCRVQEIEAAAGEVHVSTAQGTRSYAAAVIAAGAWSSSIKLINAPALPPAEPVKGQMIAYLQPLRTCNTILRQGHRYMLQRENGLLIVGASMEHAGFDRTVSDTVTHDLAAWASSLLPHLAETTPVDSWVGFRPSASGLQVGAWHSKRLWLAYGHFRNGILLAPLTASRLAAEVTSNLGMRPDALV